MNAKTTSTQGYLGVWIALMVLLAATWGFARVDLGAANTAVALLISGIKMLLVILVFMQVKFHGRSVWIFAAAGFFWFLIMVTMTLGDYTTRQSVPPPASSPPSNQLQPSR